MAMTAKNRVGQWGERKRFPPVGPPGLSSCLDFGVEGEGLQREEAGMMPGTWSERECGELR